MIRAMTSRGHAYRIHQLGAKPSEQFPRVLGDKQQHRGDGAELDSNPGEPDRDDRDPVIS